MSKTKRNQVLLNGTERLSARTRSRIATALKRFNDVTPPVVTIDGELYTVVSVEVRS
jgi:hypothetical protein